MSKLSMASALLTVLLMALAIGPAQPAQAPASDETPEFQATDLAGALADDGSFVGDSGISGTVDASAWTLTSNLAAGAPPRFVPTSEVTASSTAGWSALGSNPAGTDGAVNGTVNALAVSGSNLYIGGEFTNVAGIATADYVARWNGTSWFALGSNGAGDGALTGHVQALAIAGSDVYVGGIFTNAAGIATADYVARWNGSAWSALGSNGAADGALNDWVNALAASGGDLYVGGAFTNAAGVAEADYVARWNGSTWSALGSNTAGTNGALNNWVWAIAISGSDVYVGGAFTNAADIATADRVARWDGTNWSALGSNGAGDGVFNNLVRAVIVTGSGTYVGGDFTNAAGIATADYVARWDGNNWSALGSNGGGDGALNLLVSALAVSGSDVYVAGAFTNAAGIATADRVARWNGSTWSALGSNPAGTDGALNNFVRTLAVVGSHLYVGGGFTDASGIATADHIVRFGLPSAATAGWSALGANSTGTDGALNNSVTAMAISGNNVYVAGNFTNAAGVATADYVARWNGSSCSALGSNGAGDGALNGAAFALAISGTDLYVGGAFTNAAGIATADYVARWNGTSWSALGSDAAGTNGALNHLVQAMAIIGSDLYVGGFFINAADISTADRFARWDGTNWSALGSNAAGTDGALNHVVWMIAVLGGDLYVGGAFTNAADLPAADYIARWNGSAWSALGSNGAGDGALNDGVLELAVAGGDLYVGGNFTNAAGIATADHVARWNGSSWSALGWNPDGTNGALNNHVTALAGSDNYLFVGGAFFNAAGIATADRVASFRLPALTPCTSAPFSDVPTSHPFCREIKWMKDEGISTGFNDGTYRPSIAVTRQAMSAFMARLAGATLSACTTAPFSDVPTSHPFCKEIKWMKESGISTGFPDGTYRPSIAVTRQAMSAFMARLANATLTDCTTPPFSDVPTTHPFCREIKWMKENGISTGFTDGAYRPSIEVTRQAMSAFMYRVSGLLPSEQA